MARAERVRAFLRDRRSAAVVVALTLFLGLTSVAVGASAASAGDVIRRGSPNRKAVACIQGAYLILAGRIQVYDDGTGVYGDETERATLDFQKRFGLAVDGEVGPQTSGTLIYFMALKQEEYMNTVQWDFTQGFFQGAVGAEFEAGQRRPCPEVLPH